VVLLDMLVQPMYALRIKKRCIVFKNKFLFFPPLIFILFLIPNYFLFAEETLTITSYYPSPYGSYNELRAKRIAIGDNYINTTTYTWEATDGDGGEVDYLADLIVEGRVGIGTVTPTVPLHVTGTSTGAVRIVDGNQASGYVLTSDANGVGKWQASSGGTSYTYYCYNSTYTSMFGVVMASTGTPQCTDSGGTRGYCPAGYTQKLALGSWGICAAGVLTYYGYFLPPSGSCGTVNISGTDFAAAAVVYGTAYVCSQ